MLARARQPYTEQPTIFLSSMHCCPPLCTSGTTQHTHCGSCVQEACPNSPWSLTFSYGRALQSATLKVQPLTTSQLLQCCPGPQLPHRGMLQSMTTCLPLSRVMSPGLLASLWLEVRPRGSPDQPGAFVRCPDKHACVCPSGLVPAQKSRSQLQADPTCWLSKHVGRQKWGGKPENKQAAQEILVALAKANSEAQLGKFKGPHPVPGGGRILQVLGLTGLFTGMT